MKSLLILALMKTISLLPLGLARYLGEFFGVVLSAINAKPLKISKLNLSLCYPDKSQTTVDLLAKKRMQHFAQTFFETPGLWRRSAHWLETKIISVEGDAYLHEALASDRGTILIAPHQGNWEVIGLWVAQQTKMTSLYQPPKIAAFGNWIKRAREKTGSQLVPTSVRGVAALLKALKKGETVGILPDQQPPRTSGAFAPLFGAQALTMTLTHNLLQRSNSQAILCCALREQGGWRMTFMPADKAIYSPDQATSLAAMNAGVEAIATMSLEQYQWEYKRFRTQPEGSPAIYTHGS